MWLHIIIFSDILLYLRYLFYLGWFRIWELLLSAVWCLSYWESRVDGPQRMFVGGTLFVLCAWLELGRFCRVLQRFCYFGATRFIPYVRLTFINIYSTLSALSDVCLTRVCRNRGRVVCRWCVGHYNFLCLLRAIFSPLIPRNLSVCRCMAIFFIIFRGMFNTAFYFISFKMYSHTLGLYFFPLYGNSSCDSLGSGSDGVSIDLQFYTLLSALSFLCFG